MDERKGNRKATPDLMDALADTSSLIKNHPYDPVGEWWSLCRHCGLARAAHASSTPEAKAEMAAYFRTVRRAPMRYPMYETPEEVEHAGGRPRISYIGDDEDD